MTPRNKYEQEKDCEVKRAGAKKIICFLVAVAAIFAMLPLNALGIAVRAANAPWYMDGLYSFTPPTQGTTNFTSKAFSISNPIFADGTVSEFSSNASGWEATSATNAVTGVVNTNVFDSFKGNQKLANLNFMKENPSSSNAGSPNVLVLANKSANGTATANFSQKLGEFWADGYFEVKVDFYAVGSQSAIYLIPDTDFEDGRSLPRVDISQVSITLPAPADNPNYLSMWQTATFLVKTDLLDSVTFKLGLYLGKHSGQAGSGVVYYDNVRVRGYSKAQFQQTFEQAKEDAELRKGDYRLNCIVDLSEPVYPKPADIAQYSDTKNISEDFNNKNAASFSPVENFTTPDNTNILPFVKLSDIPAALNIKEPNKQVFGTTSLDNTGAMLMTAVNTSVGLRYNQTITWNRNEIYMINFYALASAENIGYLSIRDTRYGTLDVHDYLRPNLYNSGFMAVKQQQTTSNASNNNWVLNTVFIIGEALEETETYIEFWVGGESGTTGYLMVDDFKVSRVSGQFYEKHKSGNNVTECNLDWLTPTQTINNANFNSGMKRSNVSAFPLVAASWVVNVRDEQVTDHLTEREIINGIINTDAKHWNANNVVVDGYNAYGNAPPLYNKPIINGQHAQSFNNNVYMMQNIYSTYQTVQSNSFTLTSDTRNVISFDAATHGLSNREVWAIIEIGGREVTRLPLVRDSDNLTGLSVSDWQNYSVVIQTSRFTNAEASITFALGSENAMSTGCLFIDNVKANQSSTAAGSKTVDLNDPSKLYLRSIGGSSDEGGESLFFNPDESLRNASSYYDAKYDVLNIKTVGASHAIVSNTMTEQITEEVPYEYIVRLSPIASVNIEDSYNTTDNPEWGLTLRLKGMDGGFVNLKTEDFRTMPRINGLIELKFFVKTGTPLDLSLEIEFGNSEVVVQGSIGIKQLELNQITDDQFNAAQETDLTRIITTSTTSLDKESEKTPAQSLDFLIIPSLIMGAATIVAVVGTLIRKTKFKIHINKQHTSYARDDFETAIPKKELTAPKAKKASNKKPKPAEDKK